MSWSPSKVSYHSAKFGGHRHYGNGDILVLVCHITSQDHVIKASCDFMGKGPSRGGERCVDFGGCRKRLHVLSLNPPLMLIFKAHSMKAHGMSYKYVRCWSHASRVTNDETLAKKVLPVRNWNEVEKERQKNKGYYKAFCATRKHNTWGFLKSFRCKEFTHSK